MSFGIRPGSRPEDDAELWRERLDREEDRDLLEALRRRETEIDPDLDTFARWLLEDP